MEAAERFEGAGQTADSFETPRTDRLPTRGELVVRAASQQATRRRPTPSSEEILGGLTNEEIRQHLGRWVVIHDGTIVRSVSDVSQANEGLPRARLAEFIVLFVQDQPTSLLGLR